MQTRGIKPATSNYQDALSLSYSRLLILFRLTQNSSFFKWVQDTNENTLSVFKTDKDRVTSWGLLLVLTLTNTTVPRPQQWQNNVHTYTYTPGKILPSSASISQNDVSSSFVIKSRYPAMKFIPWRPKRDTLRFRMNLKILPEQVLLEAGEFFNKASR